MMHIAVFAALIAAAGGVCWYARRATVALGFAVFFAVDGVYESWQRDLGGNASLAASVAIGFCILSWAMDRLSPEG